MRIVEALSAEELALLISPWGYAAEAIGPVAKVSHVNVDYRGLGFSVWLYGVDENERCSAITFQASTSSTIQFWEIEEWSRQTLFGRLRRNDEGNAELDWIVPIKGVTVEYIEGCFELWRGIEVNFIRFCMKKDDKRFGMESLGCSEKR